MPHLIYFITFSAKSRSPTRGDDTAALAPDNAVISNACGSDAASYVISITIRKPFGGPTLCGAVEGALLIEGGRAVLLVEDTAPRRQGGPPKRAESHRGETFPRSRAVFSPGVSGRSERDHNKNGKNSSYE